MFGERFDFAIPSGPLALHRAKHWAKRFWWSGYAIAGVCGVRGGATQVLPDRHQRQLGVCSLASPDYRAVLDRGIGIAHNPEAAFGDQPTPALFRSPQGSMTGDL
ncbi:MAG: hypothetical protein GDA36_09425 [Rhodobacteraceae bacterium]|nr:hypothetical protein [Paracoccaceae bacterium]